MLVVRWMWGGRCWAPIRAAPCGLLVPVSIGTPLAALQLAAGGVGACRLTSLPPPDSSRGTSACPAPPAPAGRKVAKDPAVKLALLAALVSQDLLAPPDPPARKALLVPMAPS